MHPRNVYLVLNLSTGLVSPQFHCRFDDFFETTKYGASDVAVSSTWQVLAGFERASAVKASNTSSTSAQRDLPSDAHVPSTSHNEPEELFELHNDVNVDTTEVTTPQNEPPRDRGSHKNEGALHESAVNRSAGVSRRGRVCTMSRRMADSGCTQAL